MRVGRRRLKAGGVVQMVLLVLLQPHWLGPCSASRALPPPSLPELLRKWMRRGGGEGGQRGEWNRDAVQKRACCCRNQRRRSSLGGWRCSKGWKCFRNHNQTGFTHVAAGAVPVQSPPLALYRYRHVRPSTSTCLMKKEAASRPFNACYMFNPPFFISHHAAAASLPQPHKQ